jgi:hypothetical protein
LYIDEIFGQFFWWMIQNRSIPLVIRVSWVGGQGRFVYLALSGCKKTVRL